MCNLLEKGFHNADCVKRNFASYLFFTSVIKCECKRRKKVTMLSTARHKSIPDHEQMFSHSSYKDQAG